MNCVGCEKKVEDPQHSILGHAACPQCAVNWQALMKAMRELCDGDPHYGENDS
jgi:DNA-directed RNA polymerase subunit RPC12/RpoP